MNVNLFLKKLLEYYPLLHIQTDKSERKFMLKVQGCGIQFRLFLKKLFDI